MENLLIPSAIQRIRLFLVEMCGMKVKPWATTEETLAALHATLVAGKACQVFWVSLRELLEDLARDLKARQAASPGSLVDNELLDSERYATLLDEIRSALAQQSTAPASFRRLATALSAPALGLLLFLGGAVSVGCDRTGLPGQDAGVVDATIAQPPSPDASILPTPPDARPAPDVVDAGIDQRLIVISLPDAAPVPDATPTPFDGATVTIQDIMQSCNIPDQQQGQVLACLAGLRTSWTTGIAEANARFNCNLLGMELSCFTASATCTQPSTAQDFDAKVVTMCKPVLIYLGVRFV